MKAYYHARAREYDDWWLGRGLFAGQPRPGWDDELAVLADGSRWSVYERVFEKGELFAELGLGRLVHEGRWFVAVSV